MDFDDVVHRERATNRGTERTAFDLPEEVGPRPTTALVGEAGKLFQY
jgi:hypothetical protein